MKTGWFKIVLLIIIAVLGYLFALNGRYAIAADGKAIVDKWNKEAVRLSEWLE